MAFTILNIVGLFRTILIVALIFFFIKWISKLLAPAPKNNTKKNHYGKSDEQGTTTIKYNRKGQKLIDKDKGEYIDFEEVD